MKNTCRVVWRLPALWALSLATSPLWAAPVGDVPFQALKSYDFQKRNPGHEIGQMIGTATDAQMLGEIETKLVGVLEAPESTFGARYEVARLLRRVGTARSVPALSKLLTDDRLGDVARYALERNTDASAGKALRAALPMATGKASIGIINSLGNRGEAEAIMVLRPFLGNANADVVSATVAALGKIATPEAVAVLQGVPKKDLAWHQSMIASAGRMLSQPKTANAALGIYRRIMQDKASPVAARIAATRGLLIGDKSQTTPLLLQVLSADDTDLQGVAVRFVREMPPGSNALPLLLGMDKLPIQSQTLLIGALADRGDKVLLPGLMRAVGAPSPEVRLAALRALASMPGDAQATLLLAKTAARAGERMEREAARMSLAAMRGATVDEAIIAAIPTAEPDVMAALVVGIGQRVNSSARSLVFKLADHADSGVQNAAMNALGELVKPDDYFALVRLLLNTKSEAVRNAAENLVLRVSKQMPNEAERTGMLVAGLATAPIETKASLLKVLGAMGGTVALGAVRAELKSNDPKLQDFAVRALANAPDVEAMKDLLEIAGSSANQTHRILSLRGYLRLAEAVVSKQGDKPDLSVYEQALKIATGADEKKSVISGLARVNASGTLTMLTPMLDDEAVRNEAALAAIGIARNLREKNPQEVKTILEKVVVVSKDGETLKQANEILKAIPAP